MKKWLTIHKYICVCVWRNRLKFCGHTSWCYEYIKCSLLNYNSKYSSFGTIVFIHCSFLRTVFISFIYSLACASPLSQPFHLVLIPLPPPPPCSLPLSKYYCSDINLFGFDVSSDIASVLFDILKVPFDFFYFLVDCI